MFSTVFSGISRVSWGCSRGFAGVPCMFHQHHIGNHGFLNLITAVPRWSMVRSPFILKHKPVGDIKPPKKEVFHQLPRTKGLLLNK